MSPRTTRPNTRSDLCPEGCSGSCCIAEVIALEQICKSFGGVLSVDDVSLSFHPGEAIALAGENGSGKSTLIKILSGAHVASSGWIVMDGRRLAALRPIDALLAGIHVIYQDFSLFPNLSVAENVAFGHQLASGRHWLRRAEMRHLAAGALERMQVSVDLDALVADLPVAAKQLIAVARALAHDARLIVMDEPTTALTEAEVQTLLSIITRLKTAGVSVVFVSHKLQELFSVCDRVVVLRNGRKVAEGPVAEFTTEGLFFGQSMARNVEAGLFDRFKGALGRLRTRALGEAVAGWLDRLRVKGQPAAAIQSLSGGNQQRVVLARWLAQDPKILILNGPSVGVDVGSKADIHRIIADTSRTGLATLLISDDLSELVACCNRVLIMKGGGVAEQIEGQALSESALTAALAG